MSRFFAKLSLSETSPRNQQPFCLLHTSSCEMRTIPKKWSLQNSGEEDLCNLASSIPNAQEYSSGLPGFVHELISVLIITIKYVLMIMMLILLTIVMLVMVNIILIIIQKGKPQSSCSTMVLHRQEVCMCQKREMSSLA